MTGKQKPKYLAKPKDYTALRKKTGGNLGLEGRSFPLRQKSMEARAAG
jgi:hypothetical protein